MPKKTKEPNGSKKNEDILKTIERKAKSITNMLKKEFKKETEKAPKKNASKKNTTTKKSTTKKSTKLASPEEELKQDVPKKETKTKSSSKTETKKSTTKTTSKSSKTTTKATSKPKDFSPEYYDLPFRYNQTVVKILAQTPTNLFVYWDISDSDRENLKQHFGKYFFEITKPVLIVHNETLNYAFEVDIDDFANSWYIKVNDSNCEYKIELGRRPIPINYNYMPSYDIEKEGPIKPIKTPYIYISSSNELESPNDRVLFNNKNKIAFRNIKTNAIIEKDISNFPFIKNGSSFTSIYELYKDLFKNEFDKNMFNLHNPSSGGNPSSGSLSSKFK